MKFSILFRFVVTAIFLCLLTIPAAAQYYGTGISAYTSIDYDEETNTVTAYSETEADYEVMGDYQAYVALSVMKSNGVTAAYGSAFDFGNGYAGVLLSFAGEADTTYTATGRHKSYSLLWEDEYGGNSYFDNYLFSQYESQNVYNPWSYFFSSPGYYYFRRQSIYTNLGRTYASVSTQTYSFRGSIQAQGPDISYGKSTVDLGDGVKANGNTISWKWAQNTALTAKDGIDALNLVKGKLGASQRNKRTAAFTAAEAYITTCKNAGGCDHNFPGRAFQGTDGAHVDVVIAKGVNFKN